MDNNTSTTRIFSFSSFGYEGSIVSVETFKQNEKLVQEKEDLKKEIDSLRQRNHNKSSGMGY